MVSRPQVDNGAIDDYSDLPPMSGSAQRPGVQRICPSGLCDDGYTQSLPAQVCTHRQPLPGCMPQPILV